MTLTSQNCVKGNDMAFVISSKRFNRLNSFENILRETGLTADEAIEILRGHVDGTPPLPMDLWGADIHAPVEAGEVAL